MTVQLYCTYFSQDYIDRRLYIIAIHISIIIGVRESSKYSDFHTILEVKHVGWRYATDR